MKEKTEGNEENNEMVIMESNLSTKIDMSPIKNQLTDKPTIQTWSFFRKKIKKCEFKKSRTYFISNTMILSRKFLYYYLYFEKNWSH